MGVDRGCPRCRECARSPLETLLRRDHRGEALLLLDSSGISAPSTLLESVNFGARTSARLNLTSQCQETSGSIPRACQPSPSAGSTLSRPTPKDATSVRAGLPLYEIDLAHAKCRCCRRGKMPPSPPP